MAAGVNDSLGNALGGDCRNDSAQVGSTGNCTRNGTRREPEPKKTELNADLASSKAGSGGALSSGGTMATGAPSCDGRSVPTGAVMAEPSEGDTPDASKSGCGGAASHDGAMVIGSTKGPGRHANDPRDE